MADLDIQELLQYLPHRHPMLLLDRITECEPGSHLVALKNVTINEPFFAGHFPERPVMPAVFILESMAQATGILALQTMGQKPDKDWMYYFVGVDKARFRTPVLPGDQLVLRVDLIKHSRGIWKVRCVASVGEKDVAEAELMGALRIGDA